MLLHHTRRLLSIASALLMCLSQGLSLHMVPSSSVRPELFTPTERHEGSLALRALQVTGSLDWSGRNSTIPTTATTEKPDIASPVTSEGPIILSTVEGSSASKRSSAATVLLGAILVLIVGFTILVIRRRQELARWREYRTHQLLQAQDEAFDLGYDDDFDLELVEGSNSKGTLS